MSIHLITVEHNGQTFAVRFRTDQITDARYRLAMLADFGCFPMDKAFEANQKLLQIENQQMDEMEVVKLRLMRAGFSPSFQAGECGWQVTLWHSFPAHELHRPPFGRAEKLKDAIAAAEADLAEMRSKKKVG